MQLPKIPSCYGPVRKLCNLSRYDGWNIAWDLGRTRCHNTAFRKLPGQDKIIADGSNKHIPTNLQRTYQFRSNSTWFFPHAICHPLCYLLLHLHLPCLGGFLAKKIMTHRLQVDGSFVTHLGLTAKPTFANSSIIHQLESVDDLLTNTIFPMVHGEDFTWKVGVEHLKLHRKLVALKPPVTGCSFARIGSCWCDLIAIKASKPSMSTTLPGQHVMSAFDDSQKKTTTFQQWWAVIFHVQYVHISMDNIYDYLHIYTYYIINVINCNFS